MFFERLFTELCMARGKVKKVKSMERDFWFNLNPSGEGIVNQTTRYVDLAQVASLVNRVSLRQGMEYVVDSIELVTNGHAFVMVQRLPEHWPLLNAWEKAFAHWNRQQMDNASAAGLVSTKARYRDFKIFYDETHSGLNVGNNLLPVGYTTSSSASPSEAYEWNPSQFVLPASGGSAPTVEVYGHMLGPDDASTPLASSTVGLVHAYAETRTRPHQQEPNIVDVNAENTLYGNMVDVAEVMEDVMTNFQEHNHVPPYVIDNDSAVEFYPGGAHQGNASWAANGFQADGQVEGILQVSAITGTSATVGWRKTSIGGFVAPCGLLKLTYAGSGLDDSPMSPLPDPYLPSLMLRITLAPGMYKGLLAQSMQEAN